MSFNFSDSIDSVNRMFCVKNNVLLSFHFWLPLTLPSIDFFVGRDIQCNDIKANILVRGYAYVIRHLFVIVQSDNQHKLQLKGQEFAADVSLWSFHSHACCANLFLLDVQSNQRKPCAESSSRYFAIKIRIFGGRMPQQQWTGVLALPIEQAEIDLEIDMYIANALNRRTWEPLGYKWLSIWCTQR